MTTFLLTRPAPHDLGDSVLAGRMPGAELGASGREKAQQLASVLSQRGLTAIQSSPRRRACETAQPIAGCTGIPVEIANALDDVDVGEWTGRSFHDLEADPRWQTWNTVRSSTRPPRGESMRELQDRVICHLHFLSAARPSAKVALVSHAEVIRAALLHALELPLDDFWRIDIAPASISTVVMRHGGMVVLRLNERPVL